ncbi:MAG TPA: rhodanese-like domain-containing protein [Thermoguttaceae bacterium]|nr:rhodanese-like domain-containing protein [Thermoguttaceae bacterium]
MRKIALTSLAALVLSSAGLHAAEIDKNALPPSKRTSLGLYVTAADAFEQWKAKPKSIKIIDVRTPEEFRLIGFPEMAMKIPLTRSPQEFVGRVKRIARPEDTLLIICRSGNRSAVAVNMLAQAGFKDAYSVVDGFEGDRNADRSSPDYGKRTVNGWKNAGLPWTKEAKSKGS